MQKKQTQKHTNSPDQTTLNKPDLFRVWGESLKGQSRQLCGDASPVAAAVTLGQCAKATTELDAPYYVYCDWGSSAF